MLVIVIFVSERKEGVVALHFPIGPLIPTLGWSRYKDANLVPIISLADDLGTAFMKEGWKCFI